MRAAPSLSLRDNLLDFPLYILLSFLYSPIRKVLVGRLERLIRRSTVATYFVGEESPIEDGFVHPRGRHLDLGEMVCGALTLRSTTKENKEKQLYIKTNSY